MRLDVRHLPYVHRLHMAINQRLVSPALGVVLLTGIFQVIDGDWDFGTPWISISFADRLRARRHDGRLPDARRAAAVRHGGARSWRAGPGRAHMSDEYQRQARRVGAIGALAGVLVVVAVFLMVTKPGA